MAEPIIPTKKRLDLIAVGQNLCTICLITKPVSEFTSHKGKIGDIGVWCKTCSSLKNKGYKLRDGWKPSRKSFSESKAEFELGLYTCERCRIQKPIEAFFKNKTSWNGISDWCADCNRQYRLDKEKENPGFWSEYGRARRKNDPDILEKERMYRKANPDVALKGRAKRFGLTLEELKELKVLQDNKCAICHLPPKDIDLHVDHCHTTGKVRGLLCGPCNMGLGFFKDDENLLSRAVNYLNLTD